MSLLAAQCMASLKHLLIIILLLDMMRLYCTILLNIQIAVILSYAADFGSIITENVTQLTYTTITPPWGIISEQGQSEISMLNGMESNIFSEPLITSGDIVSTQSVSKGHIETEMVATKPFGMQTISASIEISTNLPALDPSDSVLSSVNQQVSVTEIFSSNTNSSETMELSNTLGKSTKVNPGESTAEILTLMSYADVNLSNTTLLSANIEQISIGHQSTVSESSATSSLYAITETYISTEPNGIEESNSTGWLRGIIDSFGGHDDYMFFEEYDGFGDNGGYNDKDRPVGYGYHDDIVYEDYRDYGDYNNIHAYDDYEVHVVDDDYDEYIEEYAGTGYFWWF